MKRLNTVDVNLWLIAFTGHAHLKRAQCKTLLFVPNLNSPSQQHVPQVVAPIPATATKSAATSTEVGVLHRRLASPTPAASVARTTHASGTTSSSAEPIDHPAAPSRMATESLDSVRNFFPIHSADTTLLADHFARLLRNHPDQSCVAYVLHALRHGFALVSAGKHDILVFSNNLPSAFTHPAFISEQLTASCACSKTTGPFSSPPFQVMLWNWCRPQKERQAVNGPPSVQSGRHQRERQHFCRAALSALCEH